MIIKQVLLRVAHSSNIIPILFQYEDKIYYYATKSGLNKFNDKDSKALRTSINVLVKTEYIPSLVYTKLYGIPNYGTNPSKKK